MPDLQSSGFSEIDRLLGLVRRTRELLDAVAGEGALPEGGADFLADTTLPHLEGVQAGFRGWLRSDAAGVAELRYLLGQVGAMRVEPARDRAEERAAAAEARAEADLPWQTRRGGLRMAEPWHLAALAHARLVLGYLPSLPEAEVRFPVGRRTYADIAVPRGPAELADRIVELERQLWRAASGRTPARLDPAFRRTYGFFDAAERLAGRGFGLS